MSPPNIELMSKKYKGKKCVYCQINPSIRQGDHVFAREFFLETERDSLIKVPACDKCNNEKSKIEHYLTTILPFGGLHSDSYENLTKFTEARLGKNQKLHRLLQNGMGYRDKENDQNGQLVLPFDGEKYTQLFVYIAKALSWYHWNTYISPTTAIESTSLTPEGVDFFIKNFFSLKPGNSVNEMIGKNTIGYTGFQGVDDKQLSVWLFNFYNGLTTSDSMERSLNDSSCVGVITGPTKIVHKFYPPIE